MADGGLPTVQQVERFLRLVRDPANGPVLVHCKRGRGRTGIMAAVYRMEVNGWPIERAIQEMIQQHGGRDVPSANQFLAEYSSQHRAGEGMAAARPPG